MSKIRITPELQKRIDKAREEIHTRKKDPQWGLICTLTQSLIKDYKKGVAKNLVGIYLRTNQRQ